MLRTCAVCPTLIPAGAGNRCPDHAVPRRGHAHRQARAQTLAEKQL